MDNSDSKTLYQANLLRNRLLKRARHLRKWARRVNTDAYCLYDRDIPEVPVRIDRYGGSAVLWLYRRPYDKDEADEKRWLHAMRDAASEALDIPVEQFFLKQRKRLTGRGTADGAPGSAVQYEKAARAPGVSRDVTEGTLRFRVNLSDYLDTGLFLDAREKRALLLREAAGIRVLNLFAYTCTLSVAAAKGGATSVDSVDISNTYLDWGKQNFLLNDLAPRSSCRFIRADVLQFLREAQGSRRGAYDLVILDPPSFSNSKKMRDDFDVKRDATEMIRQGLPLLAPAGRLWFSSNAHGFHLDETEFRAVQITDRTEEMRDEDFRGKRIPGFWELRNR
jgi:23S rRNA G2069 N7-methylase RlmK/C1962 C5-methylase RlmI